MNAHRTLTPTARRVLSYLEAQADESGCFAISIYALQEQCDLLGTDIAELAVGHLTRLGFIHRCGVVRHAGSVMPSYRLGKAPKAKRRARGKWA